MKRNLYHTQASVAIPDATQNVPHDDCFRASQEGWDAARDEGLTAVNPYHEGTAERHAWTIAWASGSAMDFSRSQCLRLASK